MGTVSVRHRTAATRWWGEPRRRSASAVAMARLVCRRGVGWRGASSARGAASRARCGGLGGAGLLGHGSGGSGATESRVQGGAVRCWEGRGGAGDRGGTVQGSHATATCRPWRASSGALSPAALLLHSDRIVDAGVRNKVRDARVIEWRHLPARFHTNSSNLVRI